MHVDVIIARNLTSVRRVLPVAGSREGLYIGEFHRRFRRRQQSGSGEGCERPTLGDDE